MADMKENNMNDGVPSLDEAAAEAVRLSVGPRPGAGPEKPRKDRRRIIIGAAAVDWQRCVGQVLRGRVPVR